MLLTSKQRSKSVKVITSYCNTFYPRDAAYSDRQCLIMKVKIRAFVDLASPYLLDIAVETWTRILDRAHAFKYVRHVKVLAKHLDDYRRDRDGDFNLCGDDPKATWKYCMVNTFGDWIKPGVFMAEVQVLLTRDSQWNDLSRFMLNFPKLQELTWGCEEQIPASVFRCVTQNHPGLRLHIRDFKLESLNKDPEHSAVSALTPYEIELATSPCLSSITMMLRDVYTHAFEHAIMDMLAGAAPNLREVDLYAIDTIDEREIAPKHRRGTQLPTSSSGLGALRHFGIHMIEQLNALREHSLVTDFSRLESLELHHIMGTAELHWLADVHLPALEHLTFNMDDITRDYSEPANELVADMNEVVTNLIPSLPALRSIKMGGPFDEQTIRVVLDHRGHNLRRLLLSTYKLEGSAYYDTRLVPASTVDVDLIQEIRQKCPNLEELALTVLRSKDGPAEFAIYRALGTLASIRKIHLNITCPQSSFGHLGTIESFSRTCASERPLTEEQEAELDNGLSSLAIDESLARLIFRTISTSKSVYSPPLECVSLGISASDHFYFSFGTRTHLIDVLKYIGRSWICIGDPRDDRPHECSATEYSPSQKHERERWTEKEKDVPLDLFDPAIAQAICRVWPAAKTKDWKQVWHSFGPAISD